MSTSVALTYDEVLIQHVGQFGPGQLLSLFWASLHEIANAAALFIWVFLTIDSVASHSWRCIDPADAVCAAVWQQDRPDSHSFCSLHPDQWQWTSHGEVASCCAEHTYAELEHQASVPAQPQAVAQYDLSAIYHQVGAQ
jgi:hypothetical protein